MTYHMRDMKNTGARPPETLTDALLALALALAAGSVVLWLLLGAALTC
jgi:hypothetical protein